MRPVVIVGMHRSGTSALARCLNLLGVSLGPEDQLTPASPDENPRGFWESQPLKVINEKVLTLFGGAWDAPPDLPKGWENADRLASCRDDAQALLDGLAAAGAWGWKDPRSCMTLPFWRKIVPQQPVGMLIYRHPLEVAASLHKRNQMPFEIGLALWTIYTCSAIDALRDMPCYVTSYDQLLNQPQRVLACISDFLDDNGVTNLLAPKLREIEDFLLKDLRHTHFTTADLATHPAARDCHRRCYERMESLAPVHNLWWVEAPIDLGKRSELMVEVHQYRAHRLAAVVDGQIQQISALVDERRKWLKKIADIAENRNKWKRLARERKPTKPGQLRKREALTADIVICVHNAIEDVRRCLASVVACTNERHRVMIVDDGSEAACAEELLGFVRDYAPADLIRHDVAKGYTASANAGFAASTGDYMVLLNSDTIVTPSWLERLIDCAEQDSRLGMVGPLSNAATWQSIPERFGPNGDWAINDLPPGWTPERMAELVTAVSRRRYPRVPIINGFCLLIKRDLIEQIGAFDVEHFPHGYGEENDYCLRATAAGYHLAVADDVYVYHAKSKSFSHDRRRKLSKAGQASLWEKHGEKVLVEAAAKLRHEPSLAEIRSSVAAELSQLNPVQKPTLRRRSTLNLIFVLPVSGASGGIHSVVQETLGMRRIGINARIAIPRRQRKRYQKNYAGLKAFDEVFVSFETVDDLIRSSAGADIAIATIFHSVWLVDEIIRKNPAVMPAYYVQDYEPMFYQQGSLEWELAYRSYAQIPGALLFAKTDWLCRKLRAEHGVSVQKVAPSIDTDLYFPLLDHRDADGTIQLVAMVRPNTPRRGAERTMRILKQIRQRHPTTVRIDIFGCTPEMIAQYQLIADFEFINHGVLVREQVAKLFQQSDIFVDFSDYQAFGRSALEAMACGCAVMVPREGGAGEFAIDGGNAWIVDTMDEAACLEKLDRLVTSPKIRTAFVRRGLETACRYSIHASVVSEVDMLSDELRRYRTGACLPRKIERAAGLLTRALQAPEIEQAGSLLSRVAKDPAVHYLLDIHEQTARHRQQPVLAEAIRALTAALS